MNINQFGDREMMEDILSSQKFTTDSYNNFANECASPAVMSELMNILNEEHQIQHEVFSEMTKRGWYPTEPAQQQKVDQCKQKFASV
ncbi:spore coat protein [Oscillospiraceae bacterium PP1C4]